MAHQIEDAGGDRCFDRLEVEDRKAKNWTVKLGKRAHNLSPEVGSRRKNKACEAWPLGSRAAAFASRRGAPALTVGYRVSTRCFLFDFHLQNFLGAGCVPAPCFLVTTRGCLSLPKDLPLPGF